MEVPPVGTVYQLMVFPGEMAIKLLFPPIQKEEGEAVTGAGALTVVAVMVEKLVAVTPQAFDAVTV